jgi:hypothetical protein
LFTGLGGKFKFSAQDSDLEYLFWRIKNPPVSSVLKPPLGNIRTSKLAKSANHWMTYIRHSMTSLLTHTVAQPTKGRFLPKNVNQLVIFVIGLAFT